MIINTWNNFTKRKNSTKRPEESQATARTVRLKENTSIENPIFILTGNNYDLNYIQAFNHYYFVTDIISINNAQCEVHCEQDLLATYKEAIQNTTAFVAYDTTANTEIPDNRIPTKSTPTVSANSVALRSDVSKAGGFIASITGVGTVNTYVIPQGNLGRLLPDITSVFDEYIQGENVFDAIKGGLKQLVGSGQVSDNIRNVLWMPFAVSGDEVVNPVNVGMYTIKTESGIDIGFSRIISRLSEETVTVNIPWQFNDWRNTEPYTQVYLYIPFIGLVNYSASALKGTTALTVKTCLNKIDGDLSVEVKAGSQVLGTYGASTASEVGLGSSNLSKDNKVTNVFAGFNALKESVINSPIEAIRTYMQGSMAHASTVGGVGGAGAGLDLSIICYTVCHDTNVSPASVSAVMGTPTMQTKSLSGLTGYVQTSNASVDIPGMSSDKDAINSMINAGIFIE